MLLTELLVQCACLRMRNDMKHGESGGCKHWFSTIAFSLVNYEPLLRNYRICRTLIQGMCSQFGKRFFIVRLECKIYLADQLTGFVRLLLVLSSARNYRLL